MDELHYQLLDLVGQCNDGRIPLSTARFGWSVKIKSIHGDEFGKICVGSDIS